MNLTSLEDIDLPEIVRGYIWLDDNKLTSLDGSPSEIGADFSCSTNLLKNLIGGPSKVNGNYEKPINLGKIEI